MATLDDQIAQERRSVLEGYQRFMARVETMTKAGMAGETKVGQEVQYLLVGEVTGHIKSMIDEARRCPGRHPAWVSLVENLEPEALAFEALSVAWSMASLGRGLTDTLMALGSQAEIHAEYQHLLVSLGEEQGKRQAKLIAQTKPRLASRARAIGAKVRKLGFSAWSEVDKAQVGGALWNALCLTGLFETYDLGDRKVRFVGLTPRGEHLALEATHAMAWSRPSLLPTVVPPKPWTGPNRGGYFTQEIQRRCALVRTRSSEHRKAVGQAFRDGSMSRVVQAVNAIQATGFRLNQDVLALVRFAWEQRLQLRKFPTTQKVPVPALPENMADLDARTKAKLLARHYKAVRYNRGVASNVASMKRDLDTAEWLSGLDAFWLPTSLDYRGRVYPIPSFNHQRSDYVKAMFLFARGQVLGPRGLFWLKVHLANCGDFGKISKGTFEEREAWVDANMDLILDTAQRPLDVMTWTKADKPFSFYAACVDLVAALSSGDSASYVSHLPVDLDGSNSGVQHYAAALRAEEGALVNLTPGERPADLYAAVASLVRTQAEDQAKDLPSVNLEEYGAILDSVVEARKEKGGDKAVKVLQARLDPMAARLWLDYGLTRSEVKRPVMTRGYGSERYGFRSQVITDLMEPLDTKVLRGELQAHPFGPDEGRYASTWIARAIWDALGVVLAKTSEGMEWLQGIASALAKEGKGVSWTTYLGLPVVQRYEEPNVRVVNLMLYDRSATVPTRSPTEDKTRDPGPGVRSRYQCSIIAGSTGELVQHKQASALPPNFIHSQDGAHLQLSVLMAQEAGIQDFLLIHDSFGCPAGQVEQFRTAIIEALVTMYTEHDPFLEIHKTSEDALGAPLEPPPAKGSLDITQVRQALYTFA